MQPVIMHLDMNSYFASVEQQVVPAWRGQPVGICEHLGGIIIGASIEAKRWGIKTGTPVWEARKLYPKIHLAHTRAESYRHYTRALVKLVSEYTSLVEVYSIDEVFLDITKVCNIKIPNDEYQISNKVLKSKIKTPELGVNYVNPFDEAVKIALEIKKRMKTEVGDWLTCSIGLASNKILAKIGSDLKKPDGLVIIIDKNDINDKIDKNKCTIFAKDDLYHRLELTDIPGIGPRQEKNLHSLGIKTLRDLKNYPKSHLLARFGPIMGHHIYNLGQLESTWKANVHQDREIKSMGHMYTLPKEFREAKFFEPVLYKLCEMVGRRLRKKGLEGNLLHTFIYNQNYESFGESKKLGDYVFDGREIFIQAADIYADLLRRSVRGSALSFASRVGVNISGIKLIGITVANLRPISGQLSLFGHREISRNLTTALDKINQKYGEFTVSRAPILAAGKVFRDSVGFGRVKEL